MFVYSHYTDTLQLLFSQLGCFHLCIATRDNLAMVFRPIYRVTFSAPISLALVYNSTVLCARVHRRTGIVTYAASCRDLPITQAEHFMIRIQPICAELRY